MGLLSTLGRGVRKTLLNGIRGGGAAAAPANKAEAAMQHFKLLGREPTMRDFVELEAQLGKFEYDDVQQLRQMMRRMYDSAAPGMYYQGSSIGRIPPVKPPGWINSI